MHSLRSIARANGAARGRRKASSDAGGVRQGQGAAAVGCREEVCATTRCAGAPARGAVRLHAVPRDGALAVQCAILLGARASLC